MNAPTVAGDTTQIMLFPSNRTNALNLLPKAFALPEVPDARFMLTDLDHRNGTIGWCRVSPGTKRYKPIVGRVLGAEELEKLAKFQALHERGRDCGGANSAGRAYQRGRSSRAARDTTAGGYTEHRMNTRKSWTGFEETQSVRKVCAGTRHPKRVDFRSEVITWAAANLAVREALDYWLRAAWQPISWRLRDFHSGEIVGNFRGSMTLCFRHRTRIADATARSGCSTLEKGWPKANWRSVLVYGGFPSQPAGTWWTASWHAGHGPTHPNFRPPPPPMSDK